jgi:hypothetical protein
LAAILSELVSLDGGLDLALDRLAGAAEPTRLKPDPADAEATVGRRDPAEVRGSGRIAMGGTTVALIAAASLFVAGACWWLWRRSPGPVYHFRCPGCRHRLRYWAHSVGHRGICPRCRQRFIFPPVPKSGAGNRE